MMSTLLSRVLFAFLLGLIQSGLALPWVLVLLPGTPRAWLRRREFWLGFLGVVVGLTLVLTFLLSTSNQTALEFRGKVYGSLIQAQLLANLFVAFLALLLKVWPKGGAVALAAFREGVRQPMFWLIGGFIAVLMAVSTVVPYFTFGEDHLMARDLGFEVIMLGTVVFTVLLASMSISEEIEGRTAVTLMSKPVSRRQFLLGKFLGILLAGLLLASSLGWFYVWVMDFKHYFDQVHWYNQMDQSLQTQFPSSIQAFLRANIANEQAQGLLRGAVIWALDAGMLLPGLVLGFCHVMVLLAIAVALATRLPVAANVVTCVVVYVLGHLSPILVQTAAARTQAGGGGSAVNQMLGFVANAFDWILPSLELFNPTRISDIPIATMDLVLYSAEVAGYSVLYTTIVLLFGLVLFEDRDLA